MPPSNDVLEILRLRAIAECKVSILLCTLGYSADIDGLRRRRATYMNVNGHLAGVVSINIRR